MESVMHKLHYVFRIHDDEEEKELLTLPKRIKNRRIGLGDEYHDCWIEFKNVEELVEYRRKNCHPDYMVRLYFSNDHNLYKTKKYLKKRLKTPICGNYKCSKHGECEFSKYPSNKEDKDFITEYLWRCIWNDEYNYKPRRDFF